MRLIILLILFSLTPGWAQKPSAADKKVQEFEAYIIKGMKDWEVPGMAVTVVKDGKVLLTKGYGVRELGKSDAVTAQTLFACASTTKAMTAACMGMLVDEGKAGWDDPVYKHLPEFHLYDPYVTRELRIRDLFIHNSGVGNADFLWSVMNIPAAEVLHRMRNVEPSYSLRSSFIYQNIFYVAAGEVIQKLSGKPWHQFMRERIFQPLGMTRTVPLFKDVTDPNQTKPHYKIEGTITVIEHSSADQIGAAGSVWSCTDDISKWVLSMLDSSKYAGGRLLSAKTWTEMFRPQTLVPAAQFYPTARLIKPNWTTYSLGWFQHDYKGRKVNLHTGSLAGTIAIHGQLPDEKLGVYVFGNFDHAELRHALLYKAFDLFALGGTRDWSTEFLQLYRGIQAESEKKEKEFESKRMEGTKPTLSLDDYTGKYVSPVFGDLLITRDGDRLTAVANNFLKATFSHWHYDTFRGWFEKKWYGKVNMTYTLGPTGKIVSVQVAGMDFIKAN